MCSVHCRVWSPITSYSNPNTKLVRFYFTFGSLSDNFTLGLTIRADRYAAQHGFAMTLANGLRKVKTELGYLRPDPITLLLKSRHPSLNDRIDRLEAIAKVDDTLSLKSRIEARTMGVETT
jgi:hypothetical protein